MSTLVLDQESAEWLRDLQAEGEARDETIARLHALLLRVSRAEASRRRAKLPDFVNSDVDDLCVQAANDALMAILELVARGEPVPDRYTEFLTHMHNCTACREDMEGLLAMLQQQERQKNSRPR